MENKVCEFPWVDELGTKYQLIVQFVKGIESEDMYRIFKGSNPHRFFLSIYKNTDGDWSEIMEGTTKLSK